MSEMPPGLPKHPVGTFAFVGAYAVVLIALWLVIYFFVYRARGVVTP
jgi:ABC-type transporter Mla subunit MlaD